MERLIEKIEAIRREPEHIRMRYVMISVLISMFLILLLWIFSIYEGFRSVADQPVSVPVLNLPKAPSFEDISGTGATKKSPTGEEFLQSEQMRKPMGSDTNTP
jgi:hypothetical protein